MGVSGRRLNVFAGSGAAPWAAYAGPPLNSHGHAAEHGAACATSKELSMNDRNDRSDKPTMRDDKDSRPVAKGVGAAVGGVTGSVIGGAAAGATVGGVTGPVGAAVGAVVGAV